ncbi:MAG: hypothetical protein V4735_00230 [Pseudomonadota bacterium]
MTEPIAAPAPISNLATIQPVSVTAPNPETGGSHGNPLATVPAGTTVEGFVVNRDAQNNPIVRTALGDLQVTSDVFLKTGSEVVFRVDPTQTTLARIVTVDGLTPQDYNAQNSRGLTRDTISTSGLAAALPNAPTQAASGSTSAAPANPVLQAVVLQATPATAPVLTSALQQLQTALPAVAAQLAQLNQLSAGTPLKLTVLDVRLPPIPISLAALPETHLPDSLLPPRPGTPQPQTATTLAAAPPLANATPAPAPAAYATAAPTPEADPIAAAPLTKPQAPTAPAPAVQGEAEAPAATKQPTIATQPAPIVAPPAAPIAAKTPAVASNQPTVEASVIGHEPDGATILHTPFATLKVYTTQPLPTGTTLLVSAQADATGKPAPITPLTPGETIISSVTRTWDGLDQLISTIKTANPDLARDVQQRLPAINHHLTSNLIFFIAAVKQGDPEALLGKRLARQLELAAPELMARLRQDITQMQQAYTDSPLPHWSSIMLPMMFGQELVQARLFISKDPEQADKKTDSEGRSQRFVLEVGMNAIGPMQFDGFIKAADRTKSFDLIVRTAQPLDAEISQGIRAIFDSSAQITGIRGQLLFQAGEHHFVRPLADVRPTASGSASNTILA